MISSVKCSFVANSTNVNGKPKSIKKSCADSLSPKSVSISVPNWSNGNGVHKRSV